MCVVELRQLQFVTTAPNVASSDSTWKAFPMVIARESHHAQHVAAVEAGQNISKDEEGDMKSLFSAECVQAGPGAQGP
jgi:hypothetical protein